MPHVTLYPRGEMALVPHLDSRGQILHDILCRNHCAKGKKFSDLKQLLHNDLATLQGDEWSNQRG